MIITISGTPGSGKSSIGKAVAKKLGFKFYSAGDIRGKYATNKGMSIEQLNNLSEQDSSSDKLVDNHMKEMGLHEDNLVVDARLGFYFIPQSIKVFIDAKPDVRAQRIFDDKRIDEKYNRISDAKRAIDTRQKSDLKRYEKLYSINPYDLTQYDLVLDSTENTIDELAGQIYRFSMFKSNPAKRN